MVAHDCVDRISFRVIILCIVLNLVLPLPRGHRLIHRRENSKCCSRRRMVSPTRHHVQRIHLVHERREFLEAFITRENRSPITTIHCSLTIHHADRIYHQHYRNDAIAQLTWHSNSHPLENLLLLLRLAYIFTSETMRETCVQTRWLEMD